jgi:CAAX prenyl protease-like protein
VGGLEPTPHQAGGAWLGLAIPYAQYPLIYTLKMALTAAAVWFVWPGYRELPLSLVPLSIVVGVVGGGIWIGLCRLNLEGNYLMPALERTGLGWLMGGAERSGFNPLAELAGRPLAAWGFLAVRFLGLVAVVPIIEEFFLRGFLMRLVTERDWWDVPFGKVNAAAVAVGTLVPMLMHPGELVAAAVWFSMVTWLLVRTRSIWDCIAAHATTNLVLGIYVVASGQWRLM